MHAVLIRSIFILAALVVSDVSLWADTAAPYASQAAYLKPSNTDAEDLFASSVAIWGDTLVVAARGEASSASGVNGDQADNSMPGAGAVYVYQRTGDGWGQRAYLKAPSPDAGDWFGWSVALWGDTLVVGAINEDSVATGIDGDDKDNSAQNAGAVYVFVRSGDSWVQQAYLKASNAGAGDDFGQSVALHGDTLVVGATGEASSSPGVDGDQLDNSREDCGAAYVFVRTGDTWVQQAYLKAAVPDERDHFGQSVAAYEDTLVVGAFSESSQATGINGNQTDNSAESAGAAYVYVRTGSTWRQQAYLKASNTDAADSFGWSVGLWDDTAVISAPFESSRATGIDGVQNDNSSGQSGAVYVFGRSGDRWSQQAYLKAPNTDSGDTFGSSVSLTGGNLLVGAFMEAGGTTGVDGDGGDNLADSSGAAYLFEYFRFRWVQRAYLKASNTDARDWFGQKVAITTNALVVGAEEEDSDAAGIDGDAGNNRAREAGAAYAFDLDCPRPPTLAEWMVTQGHLDVLADPDSDGLNHLLTYAFGADLTNDRGGALPAALIVEVDGTRYPAISFRQRSGGDVTYRFDTTDSIADGPWTNGLDELEEVGRATDNGDGTVTRLFRFIRPAPIDGAAFWRLTVRAPN